MNCVWSFTDLRIWRPETYAVDDRQVALGEDSARRGINGVLYLSYVSEAVRFLCEIDVSFQIRLFEGEFVGRDPEVLDYLRDCLKTDNPYPSEKNRTCQIDTYGPPGRTRERCVKEKNETSC